MAQEQEINEMRNDEIERFAKAINAAAAMYDKDLTAATIELYFRTLEDLSVEQVEAAIIKALQECTFFPKPAEIRRFAIGSNADRTEAAWALFNEALRSIGHRNSLWVEDGSFVYALVSTFGGWLPATEQMHVLSDEMIAAKRKEFTAAYRIAQVREIKGAQYFEGFTENTNRRTCGTWKIGVMAMSVMSVGIISNGKVSALLLDFDPTTGAICAASARLLQTGEYKPLLAAKEQQEQLEKPLAARRLNAVREPELSLDEAIAEADSDEEREQLQAVSKALTTGSLSVN